MEHRAAQMPHKPILIWDGEGHPRSPMGFLPSCFSFLHWAGWDTSLHKPKKTPWPRNNWCWTLLSGKAHSWPAASQQPGLWAPPAGAGVPSSPGTDQERRQGTLWGHSLQPLNEPMSPLQHDPLLQVNTFVKHCHAVETAGLLFLVQICEFKF